MLDKVMVNICEQYAQITNVLVVLGGNKDEHIFYAYQQFAARSRSNIGSIEFDELRGVNITDLIKSSISNPNAQQTILLNQLNNFIEKKVAVTVRFGGNISYLTFTTV